MHEKILNHFVYVCPRCFNKVKECTCLMYPLTLIQIDKNMLPIIKELNRKYITTEACCEGHLGHNEQMYIQFKKNYKFKSKLPEGIFYENTFLRAKITGKSEQAKKRNKRALLNALYKWACEEKGFGLNMFMK